MPTLHERPFVTRLSVALASSGVLLVLSGFLIGSTPDEEEFRFAILSSWLHVRSLLHGDYVFWTSALGLGIPHPLTPNFLLHPLLPLLAIVGPVSWVRILLLAHTVLGATGMWQLTKSLAMTPPTRAICVFTFLLATPTQNYVLTNFWPSHYVVWTSMPWLLLLTWRTLDAEGMSLRRLSVALGLCGGLVIANTNPGHVIVYTTLAAAVATTSVRRLAARWRWMLVAALIAAAIASPTFAQLAHERRVLDPNSSLSNVTDPLEVSEMWSALISPWTAPGAAPVGSDVTFTRTLFFGGPFVVLALGGCVLFARRRLDLVLVVTACAVLLFTRTLSLSFVSARFEFRDPLTLAAILLAGLVLDRLLAHRPTRAIAVYVLIAQVGVVGDTAWPFLQGTRGPDAAAAMWFRGGTGDSEHVDRLLTLMPLAGRVLFSPQVDDDVYELARLQEGLGRNALAYRGVSLVNGWFKGVSTNTIWPDEQLFYGRIRAPQSLLESDAALDVLGIRYVLATGGEPVAQDLRRRGVVPNREGGTFVVYENTNPWPDAFVMDAASEQIDLPLQPGCDNDRVLCRDFALVAARGSTDGLVVQHGDGAIDVRLFRATEPRVLVVSQMFRSDWAATADGRPLTTVPMFGGLLGVRLPPDVTSVRIRYRPVTLILATVLAWCALLGGAVSLLWLAGKNRGLQLNPWVGTAGE